MAVYYDETGDFDSVMKTELRSLDIISMMREQERDAKSALETISKHKAELSSDFDYLESLLTRRINLANDRISREASRQNEFLMSLSRFSVFDLERARDILQGKRTEHVRDFVDNADRVIQGRIDSARK
ncbi:hypothetical protein [Weissella confusa]|uniref:hypothetical protein n=1 Tax=Weissella confusa TaxID=1583 RepID=UPI0018F165F2|nr:hypothetical protein [Weissella confusa]MBJ7686966.1 hypothetical protein [Weissella confusa]MBJ7697475.1 hypothetical protein [Weissella confusa]